VGAFAPPQTQESAAPQPLTFSTATNRDSARAPSPAVDEEEPAKTQEAVPLANGSGPEQVREAVVAALAAGGHSSAAQLLGAGEWTIDGTGVRVLAPGLGKKMLSLTVNAAAEKIIRQELQRLGAPARFMVTPGEGIAPASVAAPPAVGSVQEAALANPLVKRAQEIFRAEVRSVVDLRQK